MLSPQEVIDEYYLEFRCKLLEVAAMMDRLDRSVAHHGVGAVPHDAGWEKCLHALELLSDKGSCSDRAEQVALHFSDAPIYE